MAIRDAPFPPDSGEAHLGVCCNQATYCSPFFFLRTDRVSILLCLGLQVLLPLITHEGPEQLEARWAAGETEPGRTQPMLSVLVALLPL